MKKLALIAALAICSLSARSQTNDFNNQTNCDLELRVICIDESSCTHTVSSSWMSMPANTTTSMPSVGGYCTSPAVQGYEVRYASSTGCSGSGSLLFTTNMMNPCPPTYHESGAPLPICSPCADNEAGDPRNVTLHWSPSSNHFDASY